MEDVLFVIPARGGSKRLPRKNILPLAGKPLIAWTIEAALQSGIAGEVCVSTDDEEIARVSRDFGASVPFLRPPELASDTAGSAAVVLHAIEFYRQVQGRDFGTVAFLQPTSSLRNAEDVRAAFELLRDRGAENVVSVCPVDHSPLWSNVLPEDGSLKGFIRDEVKGKRSQDLPQYYRLNGAIYICAVDRFLRDRSLLLETKAYAYVMSQEHSIDIDTELDFRFAEALIYCLHRPG
jgi:CMP-N-acetylneuraminic acid synthetase